MNRAHQCGNFNIARGKFGSWTCKVCGLEAFRTGVGSRWLIEPANCPGQRPATVSASLAHRLLIFWFCLAPAQQWLWMPEPQPRGALLQTAVELALYDY